MRSSATRDRRLEITDGGHALDLFAWTSEMLVINALSMDAFTHLQLQVLAAGGLNAARWN